MKALVVFCAAAGILAFPAFGQAPAPASQSSPAPPSSPPAAAALPAPPSGDESLVVQELDVVARRPGPALWRVSKGDSEVVILGGLTPLPHLLQWDTIRVTHALESATVLFLPPQGVQVGVFDAASMLLRQGALRPEHGRIMEDTLPPALRARFERVRDSIHLDKARYQHWKPAVAGLLLLADFRRAAGLSEAKPGSTVAKLARAAHAEVRTVGALKARPLFDAAARMTDAQNQACLSAALDDVEREAAHARIAAEAWAVGDLNAVKANSSASLLESCLLQLPNVEAVVEQGTEDAVKTINAALDRPGRSVAVIDLHFLLRPNGVLDRLKAAGDKITIPGG